MNSGFARVPSWFSGFGWYPSARHEHQRQRQHQHAFGVVWCGPGSARLRPRLADTAAGFRAAMLEHRLLWFRKELLAVLRCPAVLGVHSAAINPIIFCLVALYMQTRRHGVLVAAMMRWGSSLEQRTRAQCAMWTQAQFVGSRSRSL